MQSINFNEGYKEFCINNDESRIIRFNPADIGILDRFASARKNILNAVNEIDDDVNLKVDGTTADESEEAVAALSKVKDIIFGQIDYIFNAQVCDVAFGGQSPISTVGGKFLYERFLEAASTIIEAEVKAEMKQSQKRINKYASQVK